MDFSININVSYSLTEWRGLGFSYIRSGQLKWRLSIGLQLLCAAIMLVGSIWMPESPRWLVVQKRHEQALRVLEKLHGTKSNESEDDEEVPIYKREFNQIEAQIRLEQENPQLGIIPIMKRPSYRKRLLLILFSFTFQQLTAIIPLQNYRSSSINLSGFPARSFGLSWSLGITRCYLCLWRCVLFRPTWPPQVLLYLHVWSTRRKYHASSILGSIRA